MVNQSGTDAGQAFLGRIAENSPTSVAGKQQSVFLLEVDVAATAPAGSLRGVGPRLAERLAAQGVRTVEDLALWPPRGYRDRRRVLPISALREGQYAVTGGVVVIVTRGVVVVKRGGGIVIATARVDSATGRAKKRRRADRKDYRNKRPATAIDLALHDPRPPES